MISLEVNSSIPHDFVDLCIVKYRDHPSIVLIRQIALAPKKVFLIELTLYYPMFPFDSPENIRKQKVF